MDGISIRLVFSPQSVFLDVEETSSCGFFSSQEKYDDGRNGRSDGDERFSQRRDGDDISTDTPLTRRARRQALPAQGGMPYFAGIAGDSLPPHELWGSPLLEGRWAAANLATAARRVHRQARHVEARYRGMMPVL